MISFFASTANGFDLFARARRFTLVLAAAGLCFSSLSVKAENDGLPASADQIAQQAIDEAGPANDIEGIYEAVYEDSANGKFRLRHFLNVDGQRQELHLKQSVSEVVSGAKVRVRGTQQDDGSIIQEDGNVLLTLAAGAGADGGSNGGTPGVLANTTGEQRTLVLMANFQENPTEQPLTVDQARALVFGQVSNFYYENSYQKTTLAGDVYGWLTLPVSNTVCDLYAAGNAADQLATSAGIDLSSYTRIVYLFTKTPCSASGMGTVGGIQTRSYINGQFTAKTIAHELGHNFGLYHSHALDCQGVTLGNTCTLFEYGDTNDTMGNPDIGHFNAFQKSRLGWVGQSSASPVTVASTSGSYTVGVYEAATSDAKAIKIPRGINPLTGNQTWFYVEYRQAVGFDSFLGQRAAGVTNGVIVHLVEDNAPDSSVLLHMNPNTSYYTVYGYANWFDPALKVGQNFTDQVSGVTISADWADSASAGITVTMGQQTCTQTKPVVALSSQQSTTVAAGTSVSYDVTVTNQDSSQCSTATVNLSSVLPSGWTGTFDAPSLSLAPGAT
ncbi:MAG: M12 family metallo-peptidase, partial [Tolumonas sp.]|nr:M12 family metallo-peptidase [Tolumonas sp.]